MNAPVGSSPRVNIGTLNAEGVSGRALRDMALIERVKSIHTANDGVYGYGKCGTPCTVRASRLVEIKPD